MNKYSLNIFWSDEDEGYIATCPEFPGLSAFGETPEEAMAEAQTALQLFIESYHADGLPLPEPQSTEEFSGQYRVRLPKSLHRQAAQMASSEGTSLNQLTVAALAEKIGAKRTQIRMTQEMREILGQIRLESVIVDLYAGWSSSPTEKTIETVTSTSIRETIYNPHQPSRDRKVQ